MAATVNVREVMVSLDKLATGVPKSVSDELTNLAARITVAMKARAPKFQSHLVESIKDYAPSELVREVRVGSVYGIYQEEGIKPGGKGLPKWTDPAAASIKEWLERTVFKGQRKPASNTMKAVMRDLELRDRYEGLAWHIRHKGVRAQPFVKPTYDEMAPMVQQRLQAAVNAAVLAAGGSVGGSAGGVA